MKVNQELNLFALDVESARVRFLSWFIVVKYEKYSPKFDISAENLSSLDFFTVDLLTVNVSTVT